MTGWLPEGIEQESPDSNSLSTLKSGERVESPHDLAPWSEEFWNETDAEGASLVRHDLLVKSRINLFAGHFEHGKTTVVGDLSRKWAESDGPVLYLDWEMGTRRVRKRLKAHGWEYALAHDRLRYLYSPRLHPMALKLTVDQLGPDTLVVIDSFSAAMMSLGLDENSATQIGEWWNNELMPVCESAGATVALISQVAQSTGSHTTYLQRGTGATAFGADVMWLVERFQEFSPTQQGSIRLSLRKDREGVLDRSLGFTLGGDGEDSIRLRQMDVPPRGEPANEAALQAVRDVLGSKPVIAEGGMAISNLIKSVEGFGAGPIYTAIDRLADAGEVEDFVNTRGGTSWRLAQKVHVPDHMPTLE